MPLGISRNNLGLELAFFYEIQLKNPPSKNNPERWGDKWVVRSEQHNRQGYMRGLPIPVGGSALEVCVLNTVIEQLRPSPLVQQLDWAIRVLNQLN
jgi:hypothetical protein